MLGYTSWHQLFVYSCISYFLSADLFMLLLFSYLLIVVYDVVIVYTIYMHENFLFLHTHWVASWRPWICTSRLDALFQLFRCWMRLYMLQAAGISFYLFWYSDLPFYFYLCTFLDSCISDSVFILVLYLYDIMRGYLYVNCSDIDLN